MNKFHMTLQISGTGFRIPENHRNWYNQVLDLCRKKHNGYATVTISTPRRIRSTGANSQNHYLNGAIQRIAIETGNDFADIKKYVKQKAISRGYPKKKIEKTDNMGNVIAVADVVDMYGEPIGISESEASVEECSLLIEQVIQLAAELGIKIGDE